MKIDHITYYGGSKEEAMRFYGEVLGFETKSVQGKVWVKIGDEFIIHLSADEETKTEGKCHFAIKVDNIIALSEKIISAGHRIFDMEDGIEIAIRNIDPKITQFFVRDPGGNLIEFLI